MIDIKDKKILYELSKNSRIPILQLAKNVGLSKDAIRYRLEALEKNHILSTYLTVINLPLLGYRSHILFLEFKSLTGELEKQIHSFFVKHPYTIWVATTTGKWDMIIDFVSKDPIQFDANLSSMLNHLGNNLKHYELLETIKENYYHHAYLLSSNSTKKESKPEKYGPDIFDYEILHSLSQDSRKMSTELTTYINLSHDAISLRIKKMVKAEIIQQFSILLNFHQLDLEYYFLFLQFNKMTTQMHARITEFLESQKQVLFYGKTAGKFNYYVDLIVKNQKDFRDFVILLRNHFGEDIASKDMHVMFEQLKNNYFPTGVYQDLIKK